MKKIKIFGLPVLGIMVVLFSVMTNIREIDSIPSLNLSSLKLNTAYAEEDEAKALDHEDNCSQDYDIVYDITINTTATAEYGAGTEVGLTVLKKLLGSLNVNYTVAADGSITAQGTVAGRMATTDKYCKSGSGTCERSPCGQL